MSTIKLKTIPTPAELTASAPVAEVEPDRDYLRRFMATAEITPRLYRDGVLTILVPTGRLREDMAMIPKEATELAHREIEAKGWRLVGEEPLGGRQHGRYDVWQPAPGVNS